MANAPNPPLPSPTPFWGLGFRFELIALKLRDIYDSIRDVWLLGPYLAIPFYILSNLFFNARDLSWEADGLVKEIKGWVDGLVSGSTFRELFERLGYHTWQLLHDPRGWLSDRIRDLSTDLWTIYTNASAWLELRIGYIFPFLRDIRDNAAGWLRVVLATAFGYAAQVLISPDSYIRSKVEQLYPILVSFLATPSGFIVQRLTASYPFFVNFLNDPQGEVSRWVEQRNPQLGELLRDPLGTFRGWLLSELGVTPDASLDLASNLIIALAQRVLTAQSILRARLVNVICDVIVSFL